LQSVCKVPGDDVELALTDAGAPAVDRTILIFLYFVHDAEVIGDC
jgi:hypothetical protein